MLYTIAVILIILWLLGLLTSLHAGRLIHILLAIAIVAVLLRVIQGRPAAVSLNPLKENPHEQDLSALSCCLRFRR